MGTGSLLVVEFDERVGGTGELARSLEEGQLDDEEVFEQFAALLGDEFASGLRRAAYLYP